MQKAINKIEWTTIVKDVKSLRRLWYQEVKKKSMEGGLQGGVHLGAMIELKWLLGEIVSHIPIMLILGTFFSETNKHRIMKLYIATFPLSMEKLGFL